MPTPSILPRSHRAGVILCCGRCPSREACIRGQVVVGGRYFRDGVQAERHRLGRRLVGRSGGGRGRGCVLVGANGRENGVSAQFARNKTHI